VEYVDENGIKGAGELVDVSRSGLKLETPTKLSKGVTLALKAPQLEQLENTAPFMARVLWSKKAGQGNFSSGLSLPSGAENDPHWLEALLRHLGYTDEIDQRREYIRAESRIGATLTLEHDTSAKTVEVLNLGMGGALIRHTDALPKDSQFTLKIGPWESLPALSLEGTVLRNIEKPELGCVLHPSRFRPKDEHDSGVLQEYILKFSRLGE
jgi:hypothetical protein